MSWYKSSAWRRGPGLTSSPGNSQSNALQRIRTSLKGRLIRPSQETVFIAHFII
ncbi:hypothetical protein OKW46_001956 [Paraburkholderia sp. WSM4179]|nr:hypothetical protein [Paraburkholderia sp. WSM4179]